MTLLAMSLSEIDPSSLADILKRSNGRLRKLLIIDCRCFIDYNDSHIRSAINAFYSKLVRRRLQENKVCALQQLLSCAGDEKARLVALSGEEGDNVELDLVLYDHQTEMPTEPATSECPSQPAVHTPAVKSLFNGQMVTPCAVSRMKRAMRCKKTESSLLTDSSKFIALLLDKLRKSNAFNQVLVLKGGFADFKARFPELCEGASTEAAVVEGDAMASSQRAPGLCVLRPPLTSLSQPCLPVSSEGPTKILPFLYLGSQQDALNSETLKRQGIDYVINLSLHCPRPDHFVQDEHFLRIPVNDSYQEKLLPYFDRAFEFLDKVREANSAVLIHCLAGISRSPTMAIAYIMKQCNMTTDEAYTYVKAKRPSISPNFNFMGQLLEYERQLKERRSKDVAQMLMRQQPQMSPNKSSGSQTSPPITYALSDSETIMTASKVAQRESNSSDTDVSTSSFASSNGDHMRRCLSCPVKMQKSVSSSELRRRDDWLDLDHQSPASTINANGKRQMRPSKSVRSEDSTYSSASSTLEQEMESEEAEGPETMRERLEMSKTVAAAPWPVVERPRGLAGLKARRALNIPQPVKEDLPSPSTELSKLSFSQSFCRTAEPLVAYPLSSCCPGSSVARSPTVENVSFARQEQHGGAHTSQVQTTCAQDATSHRTAVFATNPFFAAFSSANASTVPPPPPPKTDSPCHSDASTISAPTPPLDRRDDSVVTDQPRSSHSTSAENPMFASCSTSKEQSASEAAAPPPPPSTHRFGLSRLAHFLRRGPWTATGGPSVPVHHGTSLSTGYFAGSKSRCQVPRSSTVVTLAKAAPPPLGVGSIAVSTGATPVELMAVEERTTPPCKSQSESALLYSLCNDLDSPESGFVESPLRESLNESGATATGHPYGRDPERESIGSASSLEIIVN